MTATTALEQQIQELQVEPGTVACVWLAQASYLFKSPAGVIIMIDPYLSDYAEAQWGMKRNIPPVIDSDRIKPDLLLCTHWHEDHLDAPLVKLWAAKEEPGYFGGSIACTPRAKAWGWPADRVVELDLGMTFTLEDVTVTAHFARHETPEAPACDAVSFLLDIGGVRIWDVADTEYDARLKPMRDERLDVAIYPINGVGGNMNAYEAALLAWHVGAKVSIPMHYNMWEPEVFGPGATLDPQIFAETYRKLGGTNEVQILEVGEIVTFGAS
jgi:L-ascorbate 6-phosphate lactonase